MSLSSQKNGVMPSGAADSLCRSFSVLMNAPSSEGSRLSAATYQKILFFCGARPDIAGWRRFLMVFLSLLGLLSIVAGVVFFIAWNWASMPKMAKFALVELWIIALAVLVWWRWYDAVSQSALLALGLSFGGLFALYGQVYQTGADSWELFRAWAIVLLPLALIARRNGLWFCTWVAANLSFQLYYIGRSVLFFDDVPFTSFSWFNDLTLYIYFAVQACSLITREFLAEYAQKRQPESWLTSRWLPRVMAAYLLLTITPMAAEAVATWDHASKIGLLLWALTIATGYGYYRYRRPDLCMLTLGVMSVMVIGCVLILQLFDSSADVDSLFIAGCLMALWLTGGGAVLLHWRRQLYQRQSVNAAPDAMATLLEALQQRQLLNAEQVAEVTHFDHSSHLPWYLRAALAVGGWAAALIILMLLALLLYVCDLLNNLTAITLVIPSLIIAILAAVFLRAQSMGKQHIGLAWAIAATCGLCLSVYLLLDSDWDRHFVRDALWLLPVLVLMGIFMPNRSYRFMAVTAFIFILVLGIDFLAHAYLPPVLAIAVTAALVAAVVVVWIATFSQQDKPQAEARRQFTLCVLPGIAAGLALLCLASVHSEVFDALFWDVATAVFLPISLGLGIAIGAVLAAGVQAMTSRGGRVMKAFYLPAAGGCAAIALFSPGIGFGLMLLLAARYQGSKEWLVLAGVFLMLYLSYWYYFLSITLQYKSLLLLVTGVILLVLAVAAKKFLPENSGDAAYEN